MKILYVTTISITMGFFESLIRSLLNDDHTVDIATNESEGKVSACYREWGCSVYQIDTSRSPLSKGNLTAIRQIKDLVNTNQYDIVHCHTPVAAMCTRLACRKARKNGTKVFYTAHGFHFFKGAPKKNWLLYYPVEKYCARFTDVLITINQEDYEFAKKKLKAKKIEYVPGVGIDLNKFSSVKTDKVAKRVELGIPSDAKLLLSVGELNQNKNHETVIRAIADTDAYYIIAGEGRLNHHLQSVIAELNLQERVRLLGYRRDVSELCSAADVYVFPSFREGLSVSLMEAMASGLPIVCSKIRGNVDLVDTNGGALFDPHSIVECKAAIENVKSQKDNTMGLYNVEKIKKFGLDNVLRIMNKLYEES